MVTALLINSANRTVSPILLSDNADVHSHLADIYRFLGNECDYFEIPVHLRNGDFLAVDENGLSHPFSGGFVFSNGVVAHTIVGNGIILGTTEDSGETADAKSSPEEVLYCIKWLSQEEAQTHINKVFSFTLNK